MLKPDDISGGSRWIRTTEDRSTDLQSVPFGHSGMLPNIFRADRGTRTPDQLITNQLLYQLSYIGLMLQRFTKTNKRTLLFIALILGF